MTDQPLPSRIDMSGCRSKPSPEIVLPQGRNPPETEHLLAWVEFLEIERMPSFTAPLALQA